MLNVRVNSWGRFYFHFSLVFYNFEAFLIKQLFYSRLLILVGYEMIIANSALRASLAIYHLISNALSWKNRSIYVYIHIRVNVRVETSSYEYIRVPEYIGHKATTNDGSTIKAYLAI